MVESEIRQGRTSARLAEAALSPKPAPAQQQLGATG